MKIINQCYYVVNDGCGDKIIHCKVLCRISNDCYKVKNLNYPMVHNFHESLFFDTKQEALGFVKIQNDKVKKGYSDQIKDVSDLIKLCLSYTDYEAREVAIEKAKEFGIELDDM